MTQRALTLIDFSSVTITSGFETVHGIRILESFFGIRISCPFKALNNVGPVLVMKKNIYLKS